MIEIVNANCIDFLSKCDPGSYDVVFADPPDNLGLKYNGFKDKNQNYVDFVVDFTRFAFRTAKRGTWVSFNARHTLLFARAMQDMHVTPCVQTITFGNQKNKPGKLTNNYRPLWYVSHGEPNFFEVREPSWRQLNGDKRADPRGKLVSDVFNFPRVTGNSKQRRAWHPTQLHEGLVERCLLLTTKEGDSVLDIFAGTGTTGRVCQRINRKCTLVEVSEEYCDRMRKELCPHPMDDQEGLPGGSSNRRRIVFASVDR